MKSVRGSFRDLPINLKLLTTYLALFIFIQLLGATMLYFLLRSSFEKNIEAELKNTTGTILSMVETAATVSIKNHLRAVAEKNLQIIKAIYLKQIRGDISEARAQDLAREILFSQSVGTTGYIYCIDSKGLAHVHPRTGMQGNVFIKQGFIREQIKRKEGYLEYEWKNPDDEVARPKALYMTYFKPWDWIISVSSYRDEFTELINVSDFKDSVLSLRFGKTGYSFILTSKGRLIVHPMMEGNAYDFTDKAGREFIDKMCGLKKGKLIYLWKNPGEQMHREKLVIFNYIPELDWIVGSSCYLDEYYAPLNEIWKVTLLSVAATLLLAIPMTWMISVYIVKPIKGLMDKIYQGTSGDLTVRMKIDSKDEVGQLAKYFNYFMDRLQSAHDSLRDEVRERKQTAADLRISEQKYRTILERMEEGYYEVDAQGRFVFFNESLLDILGYPADELKGLGIRDISEPETSRVIFKTFMEVMQSGHAIKTASCELIRKDGRKCHVETSISCMEDQNGRAVGCRGVLKDITERRKAEEDLRHSEEMFSKAFRFSPVGLFIVRLDERRFIDVNDSFLAATGFKAGNVLEKGLSEIEFIEPMGRSDQIIDQLLGEKRIRNLEIDFRSASGESRMGIFSAEILVLQGERCMLAALEDVTNMRRLEREILDISQREQHRMGRTLHDDICPHLLGVEVLSNVMRQKLTDYMSAEAKNASKIQSLVQDSIVKLKQLSRGLYPIELSGDDFDSAVADLAMRTQDIFGVRCSFECELPVRIGDDAAAIHAYYIVHEALHNAVKHSKARNIGIALSSENGKVRLTIQDDGKGIEVLEAHRGMGMSIMSYRASRIGAELKFKPNKLGGTDVTLEMRH